MRALDIVVTPKGGIAMITETNDLGKSASINFINGLNPYGEKNAWWNQSELKVIDSIPQMISNAMAGSWGKGKEDVKCLF
jgi:hypothetical protein